MTGPGCYVHIPFCSRVCPYCDFAVVAGRDDLMSRYRDALIAEIDMEESAEPLDSVFVGGGTPSRMAPGDLGLVLKRLEDRFGFAAGVEITLEANPEDWTDRVAVECASVGFNRVSFGVQSFDPAVLHALGRRHTADEAAAVPERARQAGFASVSLDLIFGTVGESIPSWRSTLAKAAAAEPDHVSTYALTVEKGTELSREVAAGAPGPDPDDQAEKYQMARDLLGEAGFEHYEVSNYARPGHACRYNLNTWGQGDYLAFGLGAHGHRNGERRRNVRKLEAFLEMVEAGVRPEAGRDHVDGWEAEVERVFLGVRRREGVAAGRLGHLLATDPEGRRLIAAGKLEVAGDWIRVLDPLFTDGVARVVVGLSPGAGA